MRRKWVKWATLVCGLVLLAWLGLFHHDFGISRIAHQRPYNWDQYLVPEKRFANEPISNVVRYVNETVRSLSTGAVPQAVFLDTTPSRISKFAPNTDVERQMDEMISAFRQHEEELKNKRAEGFETGLYTGVSAAE